MLLVVARGGGFWRQPVADGTVVFEFSEILKKGQFAYILKNQKILSKVRHRNSDINVNFDHFNALMAEKFEFNIKF